MPDSGLSAGSQILLLVVRSQARHHSKIIQGIMCLLLFPSERIRHTRRGTDSNEAVSIGHKRRYKVYLQVYSARRAATRLLVFLGCLSRYIFCHFLLCVAEATLFAFSFSLGRHQINRCSTTCRGLTKGLLVAWAFCPLGPFIQQLIQHH